MYLDQERISRETVVTDLGSSVELKCNSYYAPTWTFNDGMLPLNTVTNGYALYIDVVSYYHEGSYECEGRTESYEKFLARSRLTIAGKVAKCIIFLSSLSISNAASPSPPPPKDLQSVAKVEYKNKADRNDISI